MCDSNKKVFKINLGSLSKEDAKDMIGKIIEDYKEVINWDEDNNKIIKSKLPYNPSVWLPDGTDIENLDIDKVFKKRE